ncbi:hypothetical protein BH10PSE17_BH10PSE17_39110 [soil metagenome]
MNRSESTVLHGSAMRTARLVGRSVYGLLNRLAAVLILLMISPLLVYIGYRIWRDDGAPLLFSQYRIGQHGKLFRCFKFRSMVRDADAALARLLATDAAAKAEFDATHKLRNDPRISSIGAVLRRTSLDELPQLLNVARGDMYLVGPRPIGFHEVRHYGEVVRQSGGKPVHYLSVKPGITGLWQVSGRSNTTFELRVALDQAYVEHHSVWNDIVILFKTIRVVAVREGAV